MKKILLSSFLAFLFSEILFSQALYFSAPITVASGSAYQGLRPRLALLNDTLPLITFGKTGADPAGFFTRWNGSGFNTPTRLTPAGNLPVFGTVNSLEIKTSGDTVLLLYADHTATASIVLLRSTDGGLSFPDSISVASYPANHVDFPELVILPNGNIVVSFMLADLSMTTPEFVACVSTDGGNTFSAPQSASDINPGQPCECCPTALLNEGNKVILAYRNNISNIREFYSSTSYDGGLTFTAGQRIDTSAWLLAACPDNGIEAILAGDSVYTAYSTKVGSIVNVLAGSFSHLDNSLGPILYSEPGGAPANESHGSIAGTGDTLFIAWQDNRVFGNVELVLSFRTSHAMPFTVPLGISQITSGTQRGVDMIYKNGFLHFVYNDQNTNAVIYRKAAFSPFTSISESEKNGAGIRVFPNPVAEASEVRITSENETISAVLIYDISGKVCSEISVNFAQGVDIPMSNFTKGIYFAEVKLSSGKIIRRKIICG